MKNVIVVFGLLGSLLIGGCGADDEAGGSLTDRASTRPAATAQVSSSAGMSSVAGLTESGLRARLMALYQLAREKDYSEMYTYLSPRCQAELSEQAYVDALESGYAERDFSGEPEFLISVRGSVATVVTKNADNEGEMRPNTWTFADGIWHHDNC